MDRHDMWLNHGIDLVARTILVSNISSDAEGEVGIDWQMADRVLRGLHMMRGDKQINLIINNHGGDDDHARAIISAIKLHTAPVVAVVMGRAESAAAWIMQCCDYRIMTPHSSIMLHMGESRKDKHTKYIDKLFVDDVYARMVQKDPKYLRSSLMAHLGEDWNVYPTQALELGLTDEVWE